MAAGLFVHPRVRLGELWRRSVQMDVEPKQDAERISEPYAHQGVSRWDGEYRQWRCCHCDGLAYRSHRERRAAEALGNERLLQEAGDAQEVGFRQWLHYRCGVYLGHGRAMSEQDLQSLARVERVSPALSARICAHYELESAEARQLLRSLGLHDPVALDALLEPLAPVAEPDDEKAVVGELGEDEEAYKKYEAQRQLLESYGLYYLYDRKRYARFSPEDVEAVHRRLYVSEADWAQFRALDRDYMPIPELTDPRLVKEVGWVAMQQLRPQCERCDEALMVNVPGLALREGAEMRRFWHHACYNLIAANLAERERQAMYEAFPQPERWRLDRIAAMLQRVPLLEFEQWKASGGVDSEAFLMAWERILQLRGDI